MSGACIVSGSYGFCSLRTGSLAAGFYSLITSLLYEALLITVLVLFDAQNYPATFWIGVIVNTFAIMTAILLLIGIMKRKVILMKIWYYAESTFVALQLFTSFVHGVMGASWRTFVFQVMTVPMYIYVIVVVRSYALKITPSAAAFPDDDEQEGTEGQPLAEVDDQEKKSLSATGETSPVLSNSPASQMDSDTEPQPEISELVV